MRCPQCEKFVSMENSDPEIGTIETSVQGTKITVNVSDVRMIRACADCSSELKDVNTEGETSLELSEFEGWKELTEEQRDKIIALLMTEGLTVGAEEGGTNVEEGGGGRYKKNMISLTIHFDLWISYECPSAPPSIDLKYSGDILIEHAAGEFEECC